MDVVDIGRGTADVDELQLLDARIQESQPRPRLDQAAVDFGDAGLT